MKRGRPYPPDRERRMRVKIELARRDMTISDLARALGIHQGNLSSIVSGTRHSPKTETRIAAYFGMARENLFKEGRYETRKALSAGRRAADTGKN
jgi:plasmid maintenance system antidote protein VapI